MFLQVTKRGCLEPDRIQYQHADLTRADFMSQEPHGVLIAIDWENVRRGAQLYQRNVRPAELCRAMTDAGRIFGEVMGGKAFGDWSLRPDEGRELSRVNLYLGSGVGKSLRLSGSGCGRPTATSGRFR